MLNDPAICKIIIFGMAGVIVVLLLALLYLGIKKNVYYVDEEGNEIPPERAKKAVKKSEVKDTFVPPVEPVAPAAPVVATAPVVDEEPVKKKFSLLEKAKEFTKPIDDDDDFLTGENTVVMKTMIRNNKPIKGILINVIVNGLEQQKEINGFPCTIGREDSNDLVIHEPAVSRRHAQFVVVENALYIEDISDHNGVLINGIRIPAPGKERVRVNDHIELGRAEIDIISVFYED